MNTKWLLGSVFLLVAVAGAIVIALGVRAPNPLQNPKEIKAEIKIDLVKIPAGSFIMGSDSRQVERPVHKVIISEPFLMGKYEVTQEQWQSVMEDGRQFSNNCPKCPAMKVSWSDAQEFVSKLNEKKDGFVYRLPTEAEWEYACRAGTTGDNYGDLETIAWYRSNSSNTTHPVGQKTPNAFGLYDMTGNVWEWVQDAYGDYSSVTVKDPPGPPDVGARILRGGSWSESYPNFPRSAIRFRFDPLARAENIGFRVAADPR